MSAFNFLKKIFGFTPDGDELSDDIDVDNNYTTGEEETSPAASVPYFKAPEAPVFDPEVKAKIFEGVVAIFNESLPDFLRRSVNPELQQQRLAESLDSACDQYLSTLLTQAEKYAEARLKNAADEARYESARLKEEMENVNRARNVLREQQLSSERRSRALTDRVHDLEDQLEKLEAEREQFQLENKSLLNKLKVADIQPGVVDDLTREVEDLRARLAAGESAPAPDNTAELNSLKDELDAIKAQLHVALEEKKALEAAKAELENNIQNVSGNFENATQRAEMQEAMYADLQSQLADAKAELEKAKSEAAEMEEKTNAKLEEANNVIKNFSKLEKQFENVAKIIKKREATIERLKSENRELTDALKARNNNLSSNLFTYDNAGEGIVGSASDAAAESLVEDDFEVPDWFVTEPAPVPKENDPEFGYQEPTKKQRHNDNDAQMSLF